MEFFNERKAATLLQQKAIDSIYAMSDDDLILLTSFIERLNASRNQK